MEGDPKTSADAQSASTISIHSLRMEGDLAQLGDLLGVYKFQSTPSVWRETSIVLFWIAVLWHFNPLPPYGGRQHLFQLFFNCLLDFNPLPPYGGRLEIRRYKVAVREFQSTPSVWRETS